MPPNILVIDDLEDHRKAVSKILKKAGFRIRLAPSGRSALTIQARDPADVAVIDMRMPTLDGLEVARELRRMDDSISLVGLTAFKGEYSKMAEAGLIDDWISKPIASSRKKEHIVRVVRRAVGLKAEKQLGGPGSADNALSPIDVTALLARLSSLEAALRQYDAHSLLTRDERLAHRFSLIAISSALAVSNSGFSRRTFSKALFGEFPGGARIANELSRRGLDKLCEDYDKGLRSLISIVDEIDREEGNVGHDRER